MSGPLYLAWRYLAHHRIKTGILVASITLIAFLPIGLNVLVKQSAAELTARAASTPLLIGAKGSRLELTLNSLYFETEPPEPMPYAEANRIAASGLADAIPLQIRFRARNHPIVGTTLEYFDFRGLRPASGRAMAVLGECVVGHRVARDLGVAPGDTLVSSPETIFDLAGSYPLEMKVVGVLAPVHGPDDDAIFVDIRTAWILQGLGHGHQDLSGRGAEATVLSREEGRITANAAVVEYNVITAENLESFHFHGDVDDYPVTAVIAVPHNARSRALLMGRYGGTDQTVQIFRPDQVMADLLGTILSIQQYVMAAMLGVGVATLATAALVFWLSLRLRRREIETLFKIGCARIIVSALLASEVALVLLLGLTLAGGLTLISQRFGAAAIRAVLLT